LTADFVSVSRNKCPETASLVEDGPEAGSGTCALTNPLATLLKPSRGSILIALFAEALAGVLSKLDHCRTDQILFLQRLYSTVRPVLLSGLPVVQLRPCAPQASNEVVFACLQSM
jgi:hypothetical protein